MCSPAFRYIPDEKSGDATTIGFEKEGSVWHQPKIINPIAQMPIFFKLAAVKAGQVFQLEC
ncbi:hypothetical protein DHW03_14180 [Pedobacter yonginense]|uniref:Uncharacterized protein n=1 Tax=Pedobacter yonginense TaxID=651869 RepID=A0A317EKN9_9SPHI|nr:hypothetical protein DHW03_14180 [Pedobacter yonginense]